MITVIVVLVVAVAAFVAGVLVGRNNKAKVEQVVSEAKAVEAKVQNVVK